MFDIATCLIERKCLMIQREHLHDDVDDADDADDAADVAVNADDDDDARDL